MTENIDESMKQVDGEASATPEGLIRWEQTLVQDEALAYDLLKDVLSMLPATFRLPTRFESEEGDARQAWLWLRDKLAHAITRLIDHNMNKLMQIVYRVDVPETLVNEAFGLPFAQIPQRLAELILARQLQKVFTQREYAKVDSTQLSEQSPTSP